MQRFQYEEMSFILSQHFEMKMESHGAKWLQDFNSEKTLEKTESNCLVLQMGTLNTRQTEREVERGVGLSSVLCIE